MGVDGAAPTETERAIERPLRQLYRFGDRLVIVSQVVIAIAVLLEAAAFVLQHLLGW